MVGLSRFRISTGTVLLLALIPLLGWWAYGLFDLDEGFYAAITREMLQRGDWITPHYNGKPWFEKPILLYWVAAPCVALFGDWLGPRLPSVMAALGMYALMFRFSRDWLGERGAAAAVWVCASSLLMVAVSRMMMTDLLLVASLTVGFLLYWRSLQGHLPSRYLFGLCVGLGVLAKGPVAVILTAGVVGWTFWRQPALRSAHRGGWFISLILCAAVVATWYVPCYIVNRELFVQEFLIKQNLERFQGGDKAHTIGFPVNIIFYPAILLVGMCPWIFRLRRSLRIEDPFVKFCAGWAMVIFVFFFIGGSKLPHYILPCLPPLALVLGASFRENNEPTFARPFVIAAVVQCIIANAGFWGYYQGKFGTDSHAELHALTLEAKSMGEPVIVYQMSRRQSALGTGQLKVQDTSHPSVIFYLGKTVEDVDEPQRLLSAKGTLVLTRSDRLPPEELRAFQDMGLELRPVSTRTEQKDYRLFRISR